MNQGNFRDWKGGEGYKKQVFIFKILVPFTLNKIKLSYVNYTNLSSEMRGLASLEKKSDSAV